MTEEVKVHTCTNYLFPTTGEQHVSKADFDASEQRRIAAEHRPCNVCLGQPLSDGSACICGGAGTEAEELVGLRKALVVADDERDAAIAQVREAAELLQKTVGGDWSTNQAYDRWIYARDQWLAALSAPEIGGEGA